MDRQTKGSEQIGAIFEITYNLFRNKAMPALCCAVPQDRPIPSFVNGTSWEYAGTLRKGDVPPSGFDKPAAAAGVQLTGFHLFQAIGAVPDQGPILLHEPVAEAGGSALPTLQQVRVSRHLTRASAYDSPDGPASRR